MRIATWNVNGLRARLEFVLHWLKARQPDVVGMQETKASDDDFPHEELGALGYKVVNHGQKGWNGVAIVSRQEAEVQTLGLPGREEDGARLLRARVGDIDFTTVYCPNGKDLGHADYPMKLDWFVSLKEFLGGNVGADSVLCGDFNIVPEPVDCWRGEAADGTIFCTEEERSRYSGLLALGFTGPLPPTASRRSGILVVGLPRRRLPPRHGPAHRHDPWWSGYRWARDQRGNRPRIPQEEGRQHRFGPRSGIC